MSSNSPSKLDRVLSEITGVDSAWQAEAERRQRSLTKPPGSLGRLEEIANRCAAIQRTLLPRVSRPTLLLFAGDHGVCQEAVSPYPQSVTAQMVVNFQNGGAAVNALARANQIDLRVVDVGVANDLPSLSNVVCRRVRSGTKNFCVEPAMTPNEAEMAVSVGIEEAEAACESGAWILGIGEMGIGNTTVAAALTAALTGLPAARVSGRGTGADDNCLARKVQAIDRAISLHEKHLTSPLSLLARLGGLEIAAMCGACLAGAARRRPVVIDGFIATAAAALAVEFDRRVAGYLIAGHHSPEPGQALLWERLGQRPLLDLQMRLGEGTGAVLAMTLVRSAVAAFTEMATFESAGVSDRESAPETAHP
ncbi:MAG: nicotinate-nucleotide--dimethylbenzimidazole phosphoribosyltransferase [Acidobacteriota bacterium]